MAAEPVGVALKAHVGMGLGIGMLILALVLLFVLCCIVVVVAGGMIRFRVSRGRCG